MRRMRRRMSLFVMVTNEDPPNAHQAQRRRRLSLIVKIEEEEVEQAVWEVVYV